MGHRLSKIITRTGDGGETGLADGSRRPKDSVRIAALGDVDELNSAVGLLTCEPLPEPLRRALAAIQHDLFDLGGELAVPGHRSMTTEHVLALERLTEDLNANLAPLRDFILPGGSRSAALAHVARAVCRRAERTVVALERVEPIADLCRIYLNRLSDALFVIARTLNQSLGCGDTLWKPRVSGERGS